LDYGSAIAYLESFVRASSTPPPNRAAWGNTRMATMQALMETLSHPEAGLRSVHVGGTAGKGSTSTLIAAVLQAAGHRTGLHTSPYLQEAVEKVQIDGRPIAPTALTALVERLRTTLMDHPALAADVTFIQLWTAIALQAFAVAHVDYAVVEVSLGGRYDATNVLRPEVAVITNVGHDHLNALGPTLADVAHHKAGILKPGVPAVTATNDPSALAVIRAEANAVGAPLWVVGEDVRLTVTSSDVTGTTFDVTTPAARRKGLRIRLAGPHQATNAACAAATADLLRERGATVSDDALRTGLATATLPGRFEVVQQRPTVVLDGAHNREKAESLRDTLRAAYPNRPVVLVLGVGASKDLDAVLDALLPRTQHVVATQASVLAKPAVPATVLAEAVRRRDTVATAEPDPMAAVAAAIALAGPDGLVCVTGSLYLVGAVRNRWFPAERLLEGEIL